MPKPTGQRVASLVPRQYFLSAFVQVKVGAGKAQETFMVQEEVLTAKSEYFWNVLSANNQESQTKTIELKDFEPRHFKAVLLWLWTGDIGSAPDEGERAVSILMLAALQFSKFLSSLKRSFLTRFLDSHEDQEDADDEEVSPNTIPDDMRPDADRPDDLLGYTQWDLINVWMLADYCAMPELQDHTMDLLVLDLFLSPRILWHRSAYIYQNTTEGSALRRLVAAWTASEKDIQTEPPMDQDEVSRFPPAFLYDVLMLDTAEMGPRGHWSLCAFHVHQGLDTTHNLRQEFGDLSELEGPED